MSILKTAILTILAALPLSARPAAAQPMSLEQCIEAALQKNPDITSAALEVDASEALRKSARGAFGPRVRLEAGMQRWDRASKTDMFSGILSGAAAVTNLGLSKNNPQAVLLNPQVDFAGDPVLAAMSKPIELRPQFTWSASATVVQPLAALWTVKEGHALREMGVDVAEIGQKAARRDVAFQVAEAYYRLLQAMRMADVAQKSVDNIDAQVKRAQAFFRQGAVGKNDVLRAELGLAAAKQRLIQANGNIELARGRLAMLLGLPPETAITPTGAVTDVQVIPLLPATEVENRAISERLEMKQLAVRIDQARGGERLAKSKMIPQVNALASLNLQPKTAFSPYSHSWFVGANASWDIWEGGGTYYGIAESKARLAQALAARRKAEDMIRLDARSAHVGMVTSTEALQVARAAVEQAEENFRIEQKRYEAANNTSFDVLDAENQLTSARGQHQAALYEYLIAQSNLARATGQTTPPRGL
jgi:outer membrane protein